MSRLTIDMVCCVLNTPVPISSRAERPWSVASGLHWPLFYLSRRINVLCMATEVGSFLVIPLTAIKNYPNPLFCNSSVWIVPMWWLQGAVQERRKYRGVFRHNFTQHKKCTSERTLFWHKYPSFLCRYDLRVAETVAIIKLLRAYARERNVLKFLVSMFWLIST